MWKKKISEEQLWILDDFCSDDERRRALSSEYVTVNHNNLNYRGISATTDPVSIEAIEDLIGEEFKEHTVFYRRYLSDEDNETYIHNDAMIGQWTGILFLNETDQCQGGTAFWKHKLTGWERQPYDHELKEMGIDDRPEIWQQIYQDGFNESLWELEEVVPMKANRLLLFPSPFFHSRYPKQAFGSDTESARLVKVFFLK